MCLIIDNSLASIGLGHWLAQNRGAIWFGTVQDLVAAPIQGMLEMHASLIVNKPLGHRILPSGEVDPDVVLCIRVIKDPERLA